MHINLFFIVHVIHIQMILLVLWHRHIFFVPDSTVEESAASADQVADSISQRMSLQCVKHAAPIIVKVMNFVTLNSNVHNFTCGPVILICIEEREKCTPGVHLGI